MQMLWNHMSLVDQESTCGWCDLGVSLASRVECVVGSRPRFHVAWQCSGEGCYQFIAKWLEAPFWLAKS